jgi:hypothetical protein
MNIDYINSGRRVKQFARTLQAHVNVFDKGSLPKPGISLEHGGSLFANG